MTEWRQLVKAGRLFRLFLATLFVVFGVVMPAQAATFDLSDPNAWKFYGRVFSGERGFLLGGLEDDHVEHCRPSWWAGPPYNFALPKKIFRAPFELKFRAQFFDTDVGFNVFYLMCVDPAQYRLPENCQDELNGHTDTPFEFILGNAWNQPEDDRVCVSLGEGHYDWTCRGENGTSFNAGEFHDFEVTMDADGTMRVTVDGRLLKNVQVEPCSTGWYALVLRSYDAQVDLIDGILEAQDLMEPGTHSDDDDNATTETDDSVVDTEQDDDSSDYTTGFEAGKRWCLEHPAECGLNATVCQEPESAEDLEHNVCRSTVTFGEDGRLILYVPCIVVAGENGQKVNYQARFHIQVREGRIYLELPDDGLRQGLPHRSR